MSGDDLPHGRLLLIIILVAIIGINIMSSVGSYSIDDINVDDKYVKNAIKPIPISEPMKYVYCYGRYSPKVRMNNTHIEVTDAYCTCGKHRWQKSNKVMVFENRVRFTSNDKPATAYGVIKVNPKRVVDGEFTVHAPRTKYHDIDLCMYDCSEKMSCKKFYMKRIS